MENTTFVQRRSYGWGRTILTVSVLATCLKIWVGSPPLLPQAQAAQANPAQQRKLAIAEAVRTNELLSDIKGLLEHHTLNVRIRSADNQPDGARNPRKPGP